MAQTKPAPAPNHWRVALFDLARGVHMAGEPLHTVAVAVARGGYSGSNHEGSVSYVASVEIPAGPVNATRSVRAVGYGVEGALRTLVSELAPFVAELVPPKCLSRWETTQILRTVSELTDADREMNDELMLETIEEVNDLVDVCLEGAS